MTADNVSRVVVTGAAGFVGIHLLRRLRDAGLPTVAIVRTLPASDALPHDVEYVARDLERIVTLDDVLRPDDVVVHLAARAHVMHAEGRSAELAYEAANVDVTRLLCRSAAACSIRRLVFLSSAKVFGEGRDRPYMRDDLLAPADAYARSKIIAEGIVRAAGDAGPFEWTILRPPFVYGPGGKGNFPRLIALSRLSTIVPLPLASVKNLRSIVFVGNLVDAIVHCGLHPQASGQILLPTDACDVSTPEFLRKIADASGSRAHLFRCPPALLRVAARLIGRSSEMDRLTGSLRLDARHLFDEFSWHPPFSLEAALKRSVAPSHDDPRAVDS